MLKDLQKLLVLGAVALLLVFVTSQRSHLWIMAAHAQDDSYDSGGDYSGYDDSGDSGSYSSGDSGGYDNSGDSYDNSSGGDSSGNYNPFTNSYDDYGSGDSSGYDDSSSGNSNNNSNEVIVSPGDSYDNSSYSNYDNSYNDSSSGDNSSSYDNSGDSYDNYSNYDNSSDLTSGTNDDSSWDYYDDSSYSNYDNSNSVGDSSGNDNSNNSSGSSADSYNPDDPNSDFMTADDLYNYNPASYTEKGTATRQNDEVIADKLGLESFTATETTGNGGYYATKNNGLTQTSTISEREYDTSDIPSLDEGQVLVAGATTKVTDQSGQQQGGNIDTYYIADKNNLPDDYVMSPGTSLTSSDGEYYPVMAIQDKATALSEDAKADQNGDFSYASVVDPKLNNLGIDQIGQDSKLSQEFLSVNSAMSNQIEPYNENSGEILSDFKDYGANLPSSESQADKEKDIYNYVNNNIKAADPDSTSYDSGHSLADAVSCGQGVCADKAVALVTTLNAAGIPAAQVDAPNHTFVAVLKSGTTNGSVDHYLDPMYFETYLPLQRPSVKPYQLVK